MNMNIKWDVKEYAQKFDFVYQYGEDVIGLIDADKNSFVVDLGCGNGALTQKLSLKGYNVLGIDSSDAMIETARSLHQDIEFQVADATKFTLPEKADVVFSNAVFHWISADKQELLVSNISNQLKLNGHLVCEFGGKGCAESVHLALERNFNKRGLQYRRTFYFPTIGQYAPILEKYGLITEYAVLFDRPTPQKTENGVEDWIKMFVKEPFENIDDVIKNDIIADSINDLRGVLYKDDEWFVDYVRIRIKAKKIF